MTVKYSQLVPQPPFYLLRLMINPCTCGCCGGEYRNPISRSPVYPTAGLRRRRGDLGGANGNHQQGMSHLQPGVFQRLRGDDRLSAIPRMRIQPVREAMPVLAVHLAAVLLTVSARLSTMRFVFDRTICLSVFRAMTWLRCSVATCSTSTCPVPRVTHRHVLTAEFIRFPALWYHFCTQVSKILWQCHF